ncbi:hypothetical protein V2J09_011383 [Rumex salicifolius]
MCRWQPFYFYFLFSKFVLPFIQHATLLPSNGAPDLSPSKTSEAVTFFALLSASDLSLLLRFTPKIEVEGVGVVAVPMGLPMKQVVSECGVCDVDLESGETVIDSKVGDEPVISGFSERRLSFSDACYGFENCDGSMQCESRFTLSIATDYSVNSMETVQLLVDRKIGLGENYESVLEKKSVKGKPKAMSGKKPPRPPRGLSLDSTDQKIIRELAEMAKLKRARMERMRALKKMKDARTSSSKNQLFATLFTVLFFLVILFQGINLPMDENYPCSAKGISSRTSSASTFQGPPITSRATDGGLFPMMHLPNLPVTGSDSHSKFLLPTLRKKSGEWQTKIRWLPRCPPASKCMEGLTYSR